MQFQLTRCEPDPASKTTWLFVIEYHRGWLMAKLFGDKVICRNSMYVLHNCAAANDKGSAIIVFTRWIRKRDGWTTPLDPKIAKLAREHEPNKIHAEPTYGMKDMMKIVGA